MNHLVHSSVPCLADQEGGVREGGGRHLLSDEDDWGIGRKRRRRKGDISGRSNRRGRNGREGGREQLFTFGGFANLFDLAFLIRNGFDEFNVPSPLVCPSSKSPLCVLLRVTFGGLCTVYDVHS